MDEDAIGEHTIEATSNRVPGTIAHRDHLWPACYDNLMAQTRLRLERWLLGLAVTAHVFDEIIDTRRDDSQGEAWLHGRFHYILYRQPASGRSHPEEKRPQHHPADRSR